MENKTYKELISTVFREWDIADVYPTVESLTFATDADASEKLGDCAAKQIAALLELSKRVAIASRDRGRQLIDETAIFEYVRPRFIGATTESFWVFCLDAKLRVISEKEVSRGGTSSCGVAVKDVFAPAIMAGADRMVVVHNHPSGDTTPSPEDIDLTERLLVVAGILGIDLVDHVIIGDSPNSILHTALI